MFEQSPIESEPAISVCRHGVSLAEKCEECIKETYRHQAARKTIERLQKESKFSRANKEIPTGEIEIGGEKFFIESIDNSESPVLSDVQALFERTFGQEEVDPEEVLRMAVEGKTAFGTPDEAVYKVYVVKNSDGKVASVVSGGILELMDENDQPTGKTMFMIAYAVTDKECRQGGLAREAYISAIMDAAIDAERAGKQLAFAAGECTYTSENFWNKVGWKRAYVQEDNDIKKYEELKYVQPALDFDKKTGLPADGAGEAPEHLMIDSFGMMPPRKNEILSTVGAFYRWSNIWPREAFESDEAYAEHVSYTDRISKKFGAELDAGGQLIFLDKKNREKARAQGVKLREYVAADHGNAGKEDF